MAVAPPISRTGSFTRPDPPVSDCTVEQAEAKAAVFDVTPQAIVAIDGEGRIICWNAAAEGTFGYKRIEAIGQSLAELIIPARLRERHLWGFGSVKRGVAQPSREPIQTWARRSDHSEFPVAISISTVRLNGAPAFVAHVHDLSNKRGNEAEPTAATSGSTAAGPLLPVRRRSTKPPGD
jgi:PAS domain S-box-containing protein